MASKQEKVQMVFVGSPLIDISAKVDNETLKRFGLKQDSCVHATARHDGLLKRLFENPNSDLEPGGSALNSARIAKWLLGEKGVVSFIGGVGNDEHEQWLRKALEEEHVIPLHVCIPGQKTGVCACLTNNQNERSMVTLQGAASHISPEHLDLNHIQQSLLRMNCLFIVAYVLSYSPEVVYALLDRCFDKQIVCLSLSAEYICKEHTDKLLKIMPRVDFLFGNENEIVSFAEAFSGRKSITVPEALALLKHLPQSSSVRKRVVLITRGKEAVIMDDGSSTCKHFDVPTNLVIADTIGCGDAFAGAFISNYLLTQNLETSVKLGIKVSAEVAQSRGCGPPKHMKISL